MKQISAFIDESGDPRFNEGASEYLAFSCVILETSKIEELSNKIDNLKLKLNCPELKSSAIRTEQRRIAILEELAHLNFCFLILIIDKKKVVGEWRNYPRPFYKYTQKILHHELFKLYDNYEVTVDKFGSPEFQESFKKYIERELQMDLFDNSMLIGHAKNDNLIQVADFLGGTYRKLANVEIFDQQKINELLNANKLYVKNWPNDYSLHKINTIQQGTDLEIAKCCIQCAEKYLGLHKDNLEFSPTVLTIEYLLFVTQHFNPFSYTYTGEIIKWLKENGYDYTIEEFRGKIIGNLRDNGVIISGTRKGLKIPISIDEICEYINNTSNQYLKMMYRTKKAIDTLKAMSLGEIDILAIPELSQHRKLFQVIE